MIRSVLAGCRPHPPGDPGVSGPLPVFGMKDLEGAGGCASCSGASGADAPEGRTHA